MSHLLIAKIVDLITAKAVTDLREQEVILKYGCYNSLVFNDHPIDSSIALREMTEKYRFKLKFNPSNSHSSTGLSEITQKTVQQIFKFYVQRHMKQWERYVPYASFSIISQASTNTGYSPNFLMFGFNPKPITDYQLGVKLSLQITRKKPNKIRQKITQIT